MTIKMIMIMMTITKNQKMDEEIHEEIMSDDHEVIIAKMNY